MHQTLIHIVPVGDLVFPWSRLGDCRLGAGLHCRLCNRVHVKWTESLSKSILPSVSHSPSIFPPTLQYITQQTRTHRSKLGVYVYKVHLDIEGVHAVHYPCTYIGGVPDDTLYRVIKIGLCKCYHA